jgi:hypothetical protein
MLFYLPDVEEAGGLLAIATRPFLFRTSEMLVVNDFVDAFTNGAGK